MYICINCMFNKHLFTNRSDRFSILFCSSLLANPEISEFNECSEFKITEKSVNLIVKSSGQNPVKVLVELHNSRKLNYRAMHSRRAEAFRGCSLEFKSKVECKNAMCDEQVISKRTLDGGMRMAVKTFRSAN